MAITTWISEHEFTSMSSVQDKELDELFQEVRQKYPGKFLIQSHRYDERSWLDKLTGNWIKTGTIYTLYNMLNGIDAQVINFPPSENNSLWWRLEVSWWWNLHVVWNDGWDAHFRQTMDKTIRDEQIIESTKVFNRKN